MARAKIVHSQDACTIIFKGNKNSPEPTLGVIKFPGGHVEVSRCSDGSYWIHINVSNSKNIVSSRIDYDHETYLKTKGNIPPIPEEQGIEKIAIKISNTTIST